MSKSAVLQHPITESHARRLATEWFDKTVPLLTAEAGKECLQTPVAPKAKPDGKPAKKPEPAPFPSGIKAPIFPKFHPVDHTKLNGALQTPSGKGDPPFTEVLKAVQSEDGQFLFIAVLHTTQEEKGVGGAKETVHNPLVYVVETRQRDRPPGWGRFQPYGKRVDVKGGLTRNIPDPDPGKAIKNISARLVQQILNDDVPVVSTDVEFKGNQIPDGVHVLPDPSNRGSCILHVAALSVSESVAVAVLKALTTNEPVPSPAGAVSA